MYQDPDRSNGWIQLHRKLQENPLWTEHREFSRAEAWLDILLNVQHSEEQSQILVGNCVIECGRGQSIKSLETWGSRWNWNKSKVRRFFKLLQDLSMIRHESVTKTTRITVCNYDTYNPPRNASETQVKRKRNAVETQVTPDKNVRMKECNNNNPPSPRGGVCRFAEFWEVYPVKKSKKPASDMWKRKKLDSKADDIIADVRKRQSEDRQWLEGYIPHPSTYISQERWQDDIDNAPQRGITPGQIYQEDTPCPID